LILLLDILFSFYLLPRAAKIYFPFFKEILVVFFGSERKDQDKGNMDRPQICEGYRCLTSDLRQYIMYYTNVRQADIKLP